MPVSTFRRHAARFAAAAVLLSVAAAPAPAEESRGLLPSLHRHAILGSTIPENGDLNPYAVVVAPVSAGKVREGDVLVDNFNNISNLQGTGGTIVDYDPASRKTTLLAKLPRQLPDCPGGVGLGTAMTMLKSGWIIVGSAPSSDGTTRTRGDGCLLVLDAEGRLAATWSGPKISMPWGNMAVIDRGDSASLFVSMVGFDLPGPDVVDETGAPATLHKATVLRLDLTIPPGQPPRISGQTVIADGFGHRADRDVFLIGPTGLALDGNGTLYVSDAVDNRIVAIPQADSRGDSAGTGQTVTRDGLMQRPLALAITPAGHLLAPNAKNGQVVEIDPAAGKQLFAQWIDTNQAQSPPGNGDLFGLAMKPDGSGFYYVQDDTNFLMEATR